MYYLFTEEHLTRSAIRVGGIRKVVDVIPTGRS